MIFMFFIFYFFHNVFINKIFILKYTQMIVLKYVLKFLIINGEFYRTNYNNFLIILFDKKFIFNYKNVQP